MTKVQRFKNVVSNAYDEGTYSLTETDSSLTYVFQTSTDRWTACQMAKLLRLRFLPMDTGNSLIIYID